MDFSKIEFNRIKTGTSLLRFSRYVLLKEGSSLFLHDVRSGNTVNIGNFGDSVMFKLSSKKEETEVIVLSPGEKEVKRLSFFYPEEGAGGIRLDSYGISLGFKLSEMFSADVFEDNFIVADALNKRYTIILSLKKKYGASIKSEGFVIARMFNKNSAFIITDKGVYVILEGKRSFISTEKLKLDPTSLKEWACISEGEKEYLLLSSKEKVVVISLSGEDKFYFGVFEREPFKRFKISPEGRKGRKT